MRNRRAKTVLSEPAPWPRLLLWLLPVVLFALGLWLGARPDDPPLPAPAPLLLLAAAEPWSPSPAEATAPARDQPLVAIYCTHASEEYAGQSRVTGQAGGVLRVATALAEAFQAAGVPTLLSETLHDSPTYADAYGRSLTTVETIAQQYPSVQVYIDVHRDSSVAGVSTRLTTADGTGYAKLMLVVGSDQTLPHPNWQQNYQFAQDVTAQAEALLPGISREPRVYSGRYNQHISPHALLVEIGSTDNSQEEARRSAAVLAQAIIKTLSW